MPNYEFGKIYKLWSPSKNIIYYGSTTQTISQRLTDHLRDLRKYNIGTRTSNNSAFLVLNCDDYKIEVVEEYACNNKQQLERKEGEYIKNNECVNKCVAGRTPKEWYIDNIDKIRKQKQKKYEDNKEQIKMYREANKEKQREYMKKYCADNANKIKEQNKIYCEANKEKRREYAKKYYADNANKIKEQRKIYWEANKEKIKEYYKANNRFKI